MRLRLVGPHNPSHLYRDLIAALPAWAPTAVNGGSMATVTIESDGAGCYVNGPDTVNTSQVAAIFAAHDPNPDPPPLVFSGAQPIEGRVRTTDATPLVIWRLTLAPLTGYAGTASLIAVDAGNGAVRVIRASFAVKRLNAGALSVGAPVVVSSHSDAGATAWTITPSIQGNDVLLSVSGAAGRTVDWSLTGEITSFTPAGA